MIEKIVNSRTRGFVIRVLKSGAFNDSRSVILETHMKKYLFNCGEGTYRCLQDCRINFIEQLKIKDIMITHKSWENLGGLYGMLISRIGNLKSKGTILLDVNNKVNIHGPPDVEDVMLQTYNLNLDNSGFIDARAYTQKHEICDGSYSDSQFEIEYVKIPKSASLRTDAEETDVDFSVAYIVKTKSMSSIDNSKVNALGMGANGQRESASLWKKPDTVNNGREFLGEETDNLLEHVPPVVVLECPNEDYLESMISSNKLNKLSEHKDCQPQLMIHMSPADVVDREEYRMFLDRFRTTDHLMLNKRSKHSVVGGSVYFHQCLNNLHPRVFPELPSYKSHTKPPKTYINGVTQAETGLIYDPWIPWFWGWCFVSDKARAVKKQYQTDCQGAVEDWKTYLKRLPVRDGPKYPEVVFLGTGSTEPSTKRTVSAILVHLSAEKCMLLDCGEGTLDQLRTFYGGEETDNVLTKLQAIFISHNHHDHHLGLCGVIKARRDVLLRRGMPGTGQSWSDTRLLLLCPPEVEVWLHQQMNAIMPEFWSGERRKYIWFMTDTYSKKYKDRTILQKLNLKTLRLPKSHHIKNSRAICMCHETGWKLVYTGDTRPCQEIITAGMGCDLLIHEATFSDELKERALSTNHSTMSEAIKVGRDMGAKFTVLTHFSLRYRTTPVFPRKMPVNVAVAFDLMRMMGDSGLSPFCCYYCDGKFLLLDDGINHTVANHETSVLKIKSLELNNETGKLGYRSHNFNIVPKDIKQRGQTIVAEHSPWEISVRLVQKDKSDVLEQTISSPLSKKVRRNTYSSIADSSNKKSSIPPKRSAVGHSKAATNSDEEMNSLISIMPSVVDYLKSAGKLEIWKKFNFLLASHKFPLDNIAFLLFLDVVKWFDCDTSVTMRYDPGVKKFWRIGYKIFHGKWLRFMSGPKNKGDIVKSSTNRGMFDPNNSKINFAVPYQRIRDNTEAPVPASDIKPGILSYLLDKYAEQAKEDQTFKLCFDGKKINAAIKGEQGDIDLFGFDGPPSIIEKRQRLEDEKDLIQTAEDVFVEQTVKLKENIEQMSDEDKDSAIFQLRNLVHILSLRLKELRQAKVSKEMAVAKFKKMSGSDWRKGKFLHVISGLMTVLHDIDVTINNTLVAINKLGIAISNLSKDFSYSADRKLSLSSQGNYVHLAENKDIPDESETERETELRFLKQRSEKWFAERKTAVVTGSTLYKAVGLESLKAQLQHFDDVVYQKEKEEPSKEVKERMEHGSLNEINGVATIVGKIMPIYYPSLHFFEEGCYEKTDNGYKMIISPDGSIREFDTDRVVLGVEIKCPAPKPSPVFKPSVHYNVPKYYIPQVLSEMSVLGTDRLIYVCYTEESTTVHLVKFSERLWDKICHEVETVYGEENPKRPTKRSANVAVLNKDIEEFCKTNVEFVCEVQSCKGVECKGIVSGPREKMCFHGNSGTNEESIDISTVQTWLHECLICLESSYQLTRNRASEFLGFMVSDLDRLYKEEELHAVPIAYGLKGYSLSTQTLREMMEYVLGECHKRGLYVPVCSCDGQWHRVAVRDGHDNPLTLLQLQKDVWKSVRNLDRGVIMNEIGDLNAVPSVESISELEQYVNVEIMDSGAIVVGCVKEGKRLNVSENVIALVVEEKKNKSKKKKEKVSPTEETATNGDRENVTNDLLSSLQQSDKEVTEDVQNQIQEVVAAITDHRESSNLVNSQNESILETSTLDTLFAETGSEGHAEMETQTEILSRGNKTQTGRIVDGPSVERTEENNLINETDMKRMLEALQNCNQTKKNWNIELDDFVAMFKNADTIDKCFTRAELLACTEPVLGKLKANGIKCGKLKRQLVSLLSKYLGDGSQSKKRVAHQQVAALKTLARKSVKDLSKDILNCVYAEYIFPEKLREWYFSSPFGSTLRIDQQDDVRNKQWYSIPEYNETVDHYLFMILDSYHQLCGARRLLCQNGIPAAGIKKEAIHRVAKESATNGCKLNVAIAIDLIDKQNVEFAKTTFSDKVICELEKNGAFDEAEFCQLMHDWYIAEDEPAVDVETRCKYRLALRDWLLRDVDFSKFPPYGAYIKDIPFVLYEGLLTNIERKIQLFPFTKSGSYNVRAVGSMDIENFFGTFQDIDPKGAGVLRPSDIPTALSVAVELMDAKMDPERGFHMQTSMSKVYPCNSMGSDQGDVMDTSESSGIIDLTMICPRNHTFDGPERVRGQKRRKKGDVSCVDEPARGIERVRAHHKRNEAKIMPHVRCGLQFDDFENDCM